LLELADAAGELERLTTARFCQGAYDNAVKGVEDPAGSNSIPVLEDIAERGRGAAYPIEAATAAAPAAAGCAASQPE